MVRPRLRWKSNLLIYKHCIGLSLSKADDAALGGTTGSKSRPSESFGPYSRALPRQSV